MSNTTQLIFHHKKKFHKFKIAQLKVSFQKVNFLMFVTRLNFLRVVYISVRSGNIEDFQNFAQLSVFSSPIRRLIVRERDEDYFITSRRVTI